MRRRTMAFSLVLLAAFGVGGCGTARPATYTNPVFTPDLADPSIIKADDGYYYAYGTENNWQDGMPPHMIPIVRSQDMIAWAYVADAFTRRPTWKADGGGLWAPDISRHNGVYYLYYAWSTWGDKNPGIGVATAATPAGPFTDHGPILRSREIGVENSIDPMYFRDDDGKQYLIWGSFHGIYGIALADDGMKTVGAAFQLAGNQFEAPYLIKRDGSYYLFVSSGSCCEFENSSYFAAVGRAQALKGPYHNSLGADLRSSVGDPVVWASATPPTSGARFVGPGHTAVIRDATGTDWLVYHAIDAANPRLGDATRRPLLIDPLTWKDGWPSVPGRVPSTTPQPGPALGR